MIAKQSASLLLLLCVASCSAKHETIETFARKPSELNLESRTFDGAKVLLSGYVTLTPGAHNFYDSRELSDEFESRWESGDAVFDPNEYKKYCLTIANPLIDSLVPERIDGEHIVVSGTFLANYMADRIDLGACSLPSAFVIDVRDLEKRYPKFFYRR